MYAASRAVPEPAGMARGTVALAGILAWPCPPARSLGVVHLPCNCLGADAVCVVDATPWPFSPKWRRDIRMTG
jgi:hypothetical protein